MPWGIAASIGGALISSSAAGDAADQQAQSAANAQAYQERIYNDQKETAKPWTEAGVNALGQMTSKTRGWDDVFDLSKFTASPGYQSRLEAGQKALEGSAANRGNLFSGQTGKALTRYAGDQANQEYYKSKDAYDRDKASAWGRLETLAGYGTGTSTALNSAGSRLGSNVGELMTGAGNAQAAGTVGAANAWSNAGTQIADWYANKNTTGGNTVPTFSDQDMSYSGWLGYPSF